MNFLPPIIERLIRKTESQWRMQRWFRQTAVLGAVTAGLALLLGMAMISGWMTNLATGRFCLGLLVGGAFLAWLVLGIVCGTMPEDRTKLAAAIERTQGRLMDRLNTLAFLQGKRGRHNHPYTRAIEHQTCEIVARGLPEGPFAAASLWREIAVFVAVLLAAIIFYSYYQPFQRLAAAARTRPSDAAAADLDIPRIDEPGPTAQSPPAPWGEVRITKPGSDLRAAALETIPLHIEAAANRPIQQVAWFTSVNGAEEVRHELPKPQDPRSAVYNPKLDLEQLGLKDWDVVRYYAQAICEDGKSYRSEVYFVEVFPFREDLDKMAGGEGESAKLLEQLTAMIERQQEVVRQTDSARQAAERNNAGRAVPQEGLAREEADLGAAARHLTADLQSRADAQPPSDLAQDLERAGADLREAENSLLGAKLDDALRQEQEALKKLIAARKDFQGQTQDQQEAAADSASKQPPDGKSGDQSRALAAENAAAQAKRNAEQLRRRLAAGQERKEQLQTARDAVQKMLQAERTLEQQADAHNPAALQKLAPRQQALQRSLEQFAEKNRSCLGNSQKECDGARSAMENASQAMSNGDSSARAAAGQAAAELQKLDDSLQQQQQRDRLAEAYQRKQLLDAHIRQLDAACAGQGAPQASPRLGADCKSNIEGLKAIAEQPPTSQHFGQPLRDALGDEKKQQLDSQCDKLGQSQGAGQGQKAAGELKKSLEGVARAFEASTPGMARGQPRQGRLSPIGEQALAQGLRQLQSGAARQAGSTRLAQRSQSRMAREAAGNIEAGVSTLYGNNEHTQGMLRKFREELKKVQPIDVRVIERLLEQLEKLRREAADTTPPKPGQAEKNYIDPSRFPPAYRKSIEKYFQTLSEQP